MGFELSYLPFFIAMCLQEAAGGRFCSIYMENVPVKILYYLAQP